MSNEKKIYTFHNLIDADVGITDENFGKSLVAEVPEKFISSNAAGTMRSATLDEVGVMAAACGQALVDAISRSKSKTLPA